ncbi:MAG TPA: DUF2938 family protein [Gammaproteobacteria bacterium]
MIVEALFVGVVATAVADLWQLSLAAWGGRPATDWGKVGRWVAWLPRGVIVHESIGAAPAVRGERALGWSFHYAVGIAYGAAFVLARDVLAIEATLLPALGLAALTLAAPWFVLQPGLGLGVLARRAENPPAVRFLNVATHGAFGVGLALAAELSRLAS